jgi:hypothetical protein
LGGRWAAKGPLGCTETSGPAFLVKKIHLLFACGIGMRDDEFNEFIVYVMGDVLEA